MYHRILLPTLFFIGLRTWLQAWDGPSQFVISLPFGTSQATPTWLAHPVSAQGTFATLDLPIVPPDADASLLVTVFYQEKNGFMRISWRGTSDVSNSQGEQVLCDNFYEGIGMSNQRSLLVTSETMKQSGILHFQCGDSSLGIQRIKLEWLENQTGITSPTVPDILVTPADGPTKLLSDLSGQPAAADSPYWQDCIVKVPVTDFPLRIEQGVEFNLQLDGVPSTVRLVLKESGLPWGQHLVVWMNDKRAGTVSPEVPNLMDEGFATVQKSITPYVGWREGTLFMSVSTLAAGLNTLQFSVETDSDPVSTSTVPPMGSDAAPLAVKDVFFQLEYPQVSTDLSAQTSPATPSTAGSQSGDPTGP